MDFTEARFALKLDPSGELLNKFVHLNNRVFDRFFNNIEYRNKLGVHICPGNYKRKLIFFITFSFFFINRWR